MVEEGFELLCECRARELVREHRREADRHRRARVVGGGRELLQLLEQGEVAIERRFAQPVAAVRPPPVIQHVRQMAVQREDEIHRSRGQPAGERAASARR